jgi:hypothetical protein
VCCSQPAGQTPAGARREPVGGISREEVEREPGMHKGPGWFVNRSPTITLNGQAVQAWKVPRPVSEMHQTRAGARLITLPNAARDTHEPRVAHRLTARPGRHLPHVGRAGAQARQKH